MASSSGFQIEDQTDEDFFDKLVDEELDNSRLNSEEITRNLSTLSLSEEPGFSKLTEKAEYSEEDTRLKQNEVLSNNSLHGESGDTESSEKYDMEQDKNSSKNTFGDELEITQNTENVGNNELVDNLKQGEASKCGLSFGEDLPLETSSSLDSDKIKSDGSKVTSVKEVQWSAFSADGSQEFGNIASFEPFSDFISDNSDNVFEAIENVNKNIGFTEQQDIQFAGLASTVEQNIDQNDPKYWENLYPGWKYDTNTGQWYQVDNYDAKLDAQAYNSNMTKVESVSENLNASYLQHTSHSVLESIAEENTISNVSNWNNNSQGSMEYPSHMVFDPQYPDWYYDTNTQQWYPLGSYSQEIMSSSDAVPDQMPQDMNASVTSLSLELNESIHTTNDEQYKQYDNQNSSYTNVSPSAQQASQTQTWNPSTSSSMYNDISQSNETANKDWGSLGYNWNASAHQNSLYNNFTQSEHQRNQLNMWQPQSVSVNAPNTSLPANQTYQPNNLYSNPNLHMQHTSQIQGIQGIGEHQTVSNSTFVSQNMWKPQSVDSNAHTTGINTFEPAAEQNYGKASSRSTFVPQKLKKPPLVDSNTHSTSMDSFDPVAKNYGSYDNTSGFPSYAHSGNNYSQPKAEKTLQAHLSNSYYGDQNMSIYPEQSVQSSNASQYSYALSEGRSSTGRPPHALVSFGFGGKLVVMKNENSFGASFDFGNQENASPAISVLSLSDIVKDQDDNYFHALCQPSFPGPLIGGNAAAKDINKWIDERIANCESAGMNYQKIEYLKLLFSLLKLLCQYYGKLRSPFGADPSLEEFDGPESAVAKLFASAKNNKSHLMQFGSSMCCMQNLPVEAQIQATATEVQNLLVSGRRKDALQCAQDGQLWGPALVLASQLGGQFYVNTVKKMAQLQFASGSPLRTLCLLIAGQPADVFSVDNVGAQNGPHGLTQVFANGMLDDWEENLAIITANRTKDDELVMIHLGDCLLKERREIIAAHICYLVAEANFESYSDSARLCLIAADHWNSPRTYTSPEAIQRTEVYEYSKVLGNSQFVLQSFQPYKLVYAYMLADIGRISESLKYCQASIKLLKNSGRAPEVEMLKTSFSSLEERLRTHQQGGYSSNLAPGKLVNKLFTSIDRSIHRIIGSPQAGLPPMPPSSSTDSKGNFSMGQRGSGSQSTMAMSSLVPSASVDAMSNLASEGTRKSMHNRSVSEPDFGRQSSAESKTSGAPSRFGRIGSQLFQKTIGWVSRSRTDHQAKLGESNKFYYDEKLKRWVEEGAAAPAEESALPPPPTMTAFQNGGSDYDINNALKSRSHPPSNGIPETSSSAPSESNSGIPPIPPSQNQFSARGRMGVRSRYVDTFNMGNPSNSSGRSAGAFHSPVPPSIKPSANTKFFVPTSHPPSNEHGIDSTGPIVQESRTDCGSSTSESKEAAQFPPSSPSPPLQRFPSVGNISSGNPTNGPLSRARAASWSGTIPNGSGSGSDGGAAARFAGSPPPSLLPRNPPSTGSSSGSSLQINGSQIGEELHEVTL